MVVVVIVVVADVSGGAGRLSVSLGPALGCSVWPLDAVSVQHLQQQVVQRHFVLALHAVEMLHAFVAAGGVNKREMRN